MIEKKDFKLRKDRHIHETTMYARHLLTAGKITAAAILLLFLFFPGCGKGDTSVCPDFSGTILELTEDGALVEPDLDEEIRKSADRIFFGTKELDDIGAKVGDIVSVTYTGDIAESYPAQIQAVKWELMKEADKGESSQAPSAGEKETESELNAENELLERNLDTVKAYLTGFSNEYEELMQSENCLISVHGSVEQGEERFEQFYQAVSLGEPAELTIIQFTVEGDAIIDYLNYNGTDFYLVHDNSRDGFIGTGDLYQEYTFPYLKVFERSIEETAGEGGKRYREIVLTDTETLTYEQMEMFFRQEEGAPQAEIYHIAVIAVD